MYLLHKATEDKIKTIREVSKALLAKDMTEYVEAIPEDAEEEEEQIPDELEDVDEVDERLLIKHLNKEYENFKN
jgi:phage terminase small subunit